MNANPLPEDDAFVDRLAAWEEAATPDPADANETTDLHRVERAQECVRRLRQWGEAAKPDVPRPPRVGRFRIRRELGRGGFGVVFLAYDPRLGRRVALKVPRADVLASADLLDRFQTEARAAAGLDHPNVVPVFEVGRAGPVCYIASAYCPGRSLREWLVRRKAPVPFAEAASLIASLADGVQHAHERGVVHRDLKPANVLLERRRDPAGVTVVPKVTDFGLAKLSTTDGPTQTGAILGTPSYMAPEQARGRGKEVGPAADVYALGAVLYEVLTGRPPFVGETDLDTLKLVTETDPVPPSRLRPGTPRDLETVCLKCLEKNPAKRYATAAALADELRRFLAGEPVKARPVGPAARLWRRAQRRPVVAGLTVALATAIVGGFIGITLSWQRTASALEGEKSALVGEKVARANAEANQSNLRIALANRAWVDGDITEAKQLLALCPLEHRDRNWHYLTRVCSAELVCLGDPIPSQTQMAWVAFSPDGKAVAAAKSEFTGPPLSIWDARTGKVLHQIDYGERIINAFQFAPQGDRLHLLSGYAHVQNPGQDMKSLLFPAAISFDMVTGREVHRLKATVDGRNLMRFGLPRDLNAAGDLFVMCGLKDEPTVRVLTVADGREVAELKCPQGIVGAKFCPTGSYIAVLCSDQTVVIWDYLQDRTVAKARCPGEKNMIEFCPTGTRLAIAGGKTSVSMRTIRLVRIPDGTEIATIPLESEVYALAFNSEGTRIAGATRHRTVTVWDATTWRVVWTLRGHTETVTKVAFSPNCTRLASTSNDGTVRIWDITEEE